MDNEIKVTVTYKHISSLAVGTEQVPEYDAYLFDRARDIKQTHRTMQYRSQCLRSLTVSS